MNNRLHYLMIAAYPLCIVLGVLWTSSAVEKNLYDRYIIYNEGIVFETDKIGPTSNFYSTVLDFPESPKSASSSALGVSSFQMSEQQNLHLAYVEEPAKSPIVVIRVRNGFRKLHSELVKRLSKPARELSPAAALRAIDPGEVSQIFKGPIGEQFVTRDPSGNRFLFYQKRLQLF